MEQKITPNLWFNGNAKKAAEFYIAVFPNSRIVSTSYYPASVEEGLADFQLSFAGKELTIEFELAGYHMAAINAGPEFEINNSVSFMVNFDPSVEGKAEEQLDDLWQSLAEGGEVLMPLGAYPFSKKYGWVKDRFGVTWQLILTNPEGEPRPFIIPSLMFSGKNVNHAEEAIAFYVNTFKNARIGTLSTYGRATGPATAEALAFADFMLEGQWFAVMDSGVENDVPFNEAVSFAVACDSQEEIDYLWERLSRTPEAEQCGWCKDQYGFSWQIVPRDIDTLLKKPGAYARLMEMKKLVIADF